VNTSLKTGFVSTNLESDSLTSASTSCVQHRFSTDSRPAYRGKVSSSIKLLAFEHVAIICRFRVYIQGEDEE
jgi:hypothetical protein